MEVAGKVALITGGARIGQAVAEALARRGCALALTYRSSRAAAEAAAAAAREAGARSAWLFAIHAAPAMRRAGGGRIVNVSDWLPVSGRPRYTGYTAYYASKAAVTALTESLALELAPDVLVNAVAPGPILAPPNLTPEEDAAVRSATPLGRWGGAEEIARAVVFLVETDFVTGESIRVDGGRHLS